MVLSVCRLLVVTLNIRRLAMLHYMVFVLLGLGLAIPTFAGADEEAHSSRRFGDSIGISLHFNQGESHEHLEVLRDLGVRWVRDTEGWSTFEPTPGQYVPNSRLNERLAFYKENGIGVLFMLHFENEDAYPDDPYNPKAFGKHVGYVTGLLRDAGVDYALEIGNEPHNSVLNQMGGSWYGKPPSPWLDHYVQLVHAAVREAKRADPDAVVLAQEDVWSAFYWFMEQGLPTELDGFTIHPYVHGVSIGPEQVSFDRTDEFAQPWGFVDDNRSLKFVINHLRAHFKDKLGHEPVLWDSEWGYSLGSPYSDDRDVTEELAAAFLARMYVVSFAAGVEVTHWHNLQDLADGPFGLLRNDESKRLTYQAFKTMSEQLGDYCLVKQVSGEDHPVSGIQAYLFGNGMGYKLVAWSLDGDRVAKIRTRSTAVLGIIDHLGDSVSVEFERDGPPLVHLSEAPVYVGGVLDDVSLRVHH